LLAAKRGDFQQQGGSMRLGRQSILSTVIATAAWLAVIALGATEPAAATLDDVRQSGTLRVAYREDAIPFSLKNAIGEPGGLIVNLCRAVVGKIAADLSLPEIKITYVPVTAANRFDAIENGQADLLCEATTQTLTRRKQVDFSIPTFVDGAGMMIRDDGPRSLSALAGKKIGLLAGTTTEAAVRGNLKAAEIVTVKSHSDGLGMLDRGEIVAYFADRSILMYLATQSEAPKRLRVAEQSLTLEPYALALRRGDNDFRLAVDRALSRIYRSGEIVEIFSALFGKNFDISPALQALYQVSSLPD
jgi:polar amino acid transport system substrate-binding protein/glutamate/aspartate transport system substrate-binding protein